MYIAYLAFEILFSAELFCDVQPLVQSALDGYNVSIFAFGQTHSGKTHTMVSISFFCCLCACVRKSLPLSNKTQKEKGIGTCKRVLNSMLSNNWKWNDCLWVNYFYIFCLKSMMIGLINCFLMFIHYSQEGSSYDRGLYARCFEELFDLANLDTTSTSRYKFCVTVCELYNEQVSFCFHLSCILHFSWCICSVLPNFLFS